MFLLKKNISYIYIYKVVWKETGSFHNFVQNYEKVKKKKNEGNWFDKKPFFFQNREIEEA
jgi:hypothetical protein